MKVFSLLLLASSIASASLIDVQYSCPKTCDSLFDSYPVKAGNQAALLINGEISLAARLATLEAATKSIRIQALIFTGDEAGLKVMEILKKKKAAGLDVRVAVDAVSNLQMGSRVWEKLGWQTQWMYYDLKLHGIEVEGYEAAYLQIINEADADDLTSINKRFHDKMWVIDAEIPDKAVAIVGGMNIANEYFRVGPDAKHVWRDQDAIVKGPIVQDIKDAFERSIDYFKNVKKSRPKLFGKEILNTDKYWAEYRKVTGKLAKWANKYRIPYLSDKVLDEQGFLKIKYFKDKGLVKKIEKTAKEAAAKYAALDWQPIGGRFLQSRPRLSESYINQTYLSMLKNAKSEVLIANAYFLPERDMVDAIKEAARNGAKVWILTNSMETNDTPLMQSGARSLYKEFFSVNNEKRTKRNGGELRIFEWNGPKYNEGTLHAKFAVFDRQALIIGSHNLDPRSKNLNSETALVFENEKLAKQMAAYYFLNDILKSHEMNATQAEGFESPKDPKAQLELIMSNEFRGLL